MQLTLIGMQPLKKSPNINKRSPTFILDSRVSFVFVRISALSYVSIRQNGVKLFMKEKQLLFSNILWQIYGVKECYKISQLSEFQAKQKSQLPKPICQHENECQMFKHSVYLLKPDLRKQVFFPHSIYLPDIFY